MTVISKKTKHNNSTKYVMHQLIVLSFHLQHQAGFPFFLLCVYMIFGLLLVAVIVTNSCIPRICVISLTIARVYVPVSVNIVIIMTNDTGDMLYRNNR